LRGADAKTGSTLVAAGTLLAAQHLGIAAAAGLTNLTVRERPRVIVLTSGDEVVPSDTKTEQLLPHQIRNSNGVLVHELLHRFGAQSVDSKHIKDDLPASINAVRDALDRADLVITVGGISAGERDHFPEAFDACGIVQSLKGASIQPGRPIVVGRAPGGRSVVGLPGNPVSVLACACLFVWPIVRIMLGLESPLPWREITLAANVKPNPTRRAFRPATLISANEAVVPAWAGSGDLAHTASTHGLLELPVQPQEVAVGTRLRFLPWP
jgi:molybdopterin molybdotransferase